MACDFINAGAFPAREWLLSDTEICNLQQTHVDAHYSTVLTPSEALFSLLALYASKSRALAASSPYLDTQEEICWSLAGAERSQNLLCRRCTEFFS